MGNFALIWPYLITTFSTINGVITTLDTTEISSDHPQVPTVWITFPADIADVDYQNSTLATVSNSYPVFDLNCNASYPIEWIPFYHEDDDGTSEQKKTALTHRFVSDFENPKTYLYSATLSLSYTGKLFIFTNFSCRSVSVSRPDLQTNVIMIPKERKNIIMLNITSDKSFWQYKEPLIEPNSCEVIASVSETNAVSSCWKCETKDGKDLELDFIGCKSPIQCNSIYQKQNRGKSCLKVIQNDAKEMQNRTCKRIGAHDYNPKMLVCKNYGPVLAQFYFFDVPRSENKAPDMYFDWTEMQPEKMLFIHPIEEKLYYGQNIIITCEMSQYYFSLGSWFGLLIGDKVHYNQSQDSIEDDWKGAFISSLNLSLSYPSPSKVFCFAPIWNSTDWVNVSIELNVRNGLLALFNQLDTLKDSGDAPKVLKVDADTQNEFNIGQRNRSIICHFSGEPTPQVKWEGPNGAYFHVETDAVRNISELIFPDVTYASCGEYKCIATSFLGSDVKSFTVKADEEMSKLVKTMLSFGGILIAVVAILVGFIVLRLWRIIKSQREALRLLTEAEIQEFVEGNPAIIAKNDYFDRNLIIDALPYDKKYELPQDSLKIDHNILLGSGAFGKVYKGRVKVRKCILTKTSSTEGDSNVPDEKKVGVELTTQSVEVAVKTCGTDMDVMYFKALLSEVKIMAYLGHHKNVVSLIGACTQNIRKRELYIAVELCPNGSLESFLRKHRNNFDNKVQYGILVGDFKEVHIGKESVIYNNIQNSTISDIILSTSDLLRWTYDIGNGMDYLHEKKVIHGDLAIRNVLLKEDYTAKIGDFGLARQLVECSNYVKKTQCPLPWRHMAPESLRDMEFSTKSDIWAFGVTTWEIFSLGETPYPGVTFNSQFLLQLEHGLRLNKPIFMTNNIYEYLLKCWQINPDGRPMEFTEIKELCAQSLKLVTDQNAESQDYLEVLEDGVTSNPDPDGYLVPNSL